MPGDFALSANQVLTITAGQMSSTGTVTITAEANDIDALAKELTVSAAVTLGPTGTGGDGVADADDHGRRNGAERRAKR